MSKCRTIVFNNNKGGVGKTTLAANFAICLGKGLIPEAQGKKKVLFVDMDEQVNGTKLMGFTTELEDDVFDTPYKTVLNILDFYDAGRRQFTPLKDVIEPSQYENVYAIKGSNKLRIYWDELKQDPDETIRSLSENTFLLREALEQAQDVFDYIVIDSAPSTDFICLNAICAANYSVLVTDPSSLATDGLYTFYRESKPIIDIATNNDLKVLGVVFNKVKRNMDEDLFDTSSKIHTELNFDIFKTVLHDSTVYYKASNPDSIKKVSNGIRVPAFDKTEVISIFDPILQSQYSKPILEFMNFCAEVITKIDNLEANA